MKRLVLIFCADGEAGKVLAETLRNDTTTAQLRDAGGVDLHFHIEHCDNVVIMPGVVRWKREILQRVYEGFVLETLSAQAVANCGPSPRTLKHKGFGRWFVMNGDQELSGPHTKDEAERLVA